MTAEGGTTARASAMLTISSGVSRVGCRPAPCVTTARTVSLRSEMSKGGSNVSLASSGSPRTSSPDMALPATASKCGAGHVPVLSRGLISIDFRQTTSLASCASRSTSARSASGTSAGATPLTTTTPAAPASARAGDACAGSSATDATTAWARSAIRLRRCGLRSDTSTDVRPS